MGSSCRSVPTNYCLHRLEEGSSLEQALEEARELSFVELDPSAHLEARDSAAKLAILATLAFGRPVRTRDLDRLDPPRHGWGLTWRVRASP
jgi:homoserine dehydrogenase